MKLAIGLFFAFVCLAMLSACGQNFSNGTRAGIVTKLSEKGIIYKSWEGEMLMALPSGAGTVIPETFAFNVAPQAVEKVKTALTTGERVELVYRQWWSKPWSIDHDYVIIDVRFQPTDSFR